MFDKLILRSSDGKHNLQFVNFLPFQPHVYRQLLDVWLSFNMCLISCLECHI